MESDNLKDNKKDIKKDIKNKRKYNSKKRKKILSKIKKIDDKEIFILIYKIIKKDKNCELSSNKNGVFFDMNILTNDSLDQIMDIVSDYTESESILSSIDTNFSYTPYKNDNSLCSDNDGPKLSNKEKNLLKNINKKKK